MTNNQARKIMKQVLIMKGKEGFYPIEASGTKPLAEEAKDHGELNPHVLHVEDICGRVLWKRLESTEER